MTHIIYIGNKWGVISGYIEEHPIAWCNEILHIAACEGTEEPPLFALPDEASKAQKINSVISHGIQWFQYNCKA